MIQIHNGSYFDFANPEDSQFDIEVIAHSLSNLCRFTGHGLFYSVAQHSVHVSYLCPAEYALHGLLHDASEAFLGDIASPLKALLPDYKALENKVQCMIFRKFGLPEIMPWEIKRADIKALRTEQRDVMHSNDAWPGLEFIEPDSARIVPHSPNVAKQMFLERYYELTKESPH